MAASATGRGAVPGQRTRRDRLRLAVRCPCGQVGRCLPGEIWTCEGCGRSWDSAGVPRAEYDALCAAIRRLKLLGVSGLVVAVVVFLPLVLFVSQSLLLVGLTLLAVYYFWFGPYYQRRVRQLRRSLPRWELRTPGRPGAVETVVRPEVPDRDLPSRRSGRARPDVGS